MRKISSIVLAAVLALVFAGPARAQAPREPDAAPAAKKPKRAKAGAEAAKSPGALPCPRAKWKDDPVCFGENDPSGLPLPSSDSGGKTPGHSGDASITAKTKLNQPAQGETFGNNPNPHPSGNDVGGRLGVGIPF